MARVITFSRFFPSYHPRKGEETYFVEKIWAHLISSGQYTINDAEQYVKDYTKHIEGHSVQAFMSYLEWVIENGRCKIHTIREGSRWKKDDVFSPRVWSGKPYYSKQIVFAPELKIQEIEWFDKRNGQFWRNDKECRGVERIANNDGLSFDDFKAWFNKEPFEGQIIHF